MDLTTGSGVFSIIAGLQGASGIAVDINPKAVKNAQENCLKYGVNIQVIQSDLFDKVPKEQFDYIFVNGPFFEGNIKDPLDYACYGARDFIERLFSEVKAYLKQRGRVLIVLSAGSDLKHFQETVRKNKLISNLISTKNSDDDQRIYYLYEVTHP